MTASGQASDWLLDDDALMMVGLPSAVPPAADDTSAIDALIAAIDADDAALLAAKTRPLARRLPQFVQAGAAARPARKLPRFDTAGSSSAPPLPLLAMSVPTIFTRSEGECDELCGALLAEVDEGKLWVVGFDIEWTVTYKAGKNQRPAALVQLASAAAVHIFHVAAMARFPERLATLIEDGRVLKAGSKLVNDMHKLRRDFGLCAAGVLEHQRLAAAALMYGERPWSLSELCETCLRKRLPKEESVRTGDWEAPCLSDEQLRYAALDAHASRVIAVDLIRRLAAAQPDAAAADITRQFVESIEPDPMWTRRAEGQQWLVRRP